MSESLLPGVYVEEVPRKKGMTTFATLKLPDSEQHKLQDLVHQVKQAQHIREENIAPFSPREAVGISALFTGPSGTGKTLAAQVLSHELSLELYRIDLAAIINKYIGETEKNLDVLFDLAKGFSGILFFDEADALFAKRTGSSDAHDRYAYPEVSYLLQRIESFDGVVILDSNSTEHIDKAFVRRIQTVIHFPLPIKAERYRIWQRVGLWMKRMFLRRST